MQSYRSFEAGGKVLELVEFEGQGVCSVEVGGQTVEGEDPNAVIKAVQHSVFTVDVEGENVIAFDPTRLGPDARLVKKAA